MAKKAKKPDLSKKVMKTIRTQKVKMKPRLWFALSSLLLGIGLAISLVLAVFFVNLVLFKIQTQGPLAFLLLGRLGIKGFLANFPWLPIILAFSGVAGGLFLLKRYDFSYKKSFWGIALLVMAFILTLGFLVDRIGANKKIAEFVVLRRAYRQEFSGQDWVVGEIVAVNQEEILLETPLRKEVRVIRGEDTLVPTDSDLSVGQRIRVVGEWQNGDFKAKGIVEGRVAWRRLKPLFLKKIKGAKSFKPSR